MSTANEVKLRNVGDEITLYNVSASRVSVGKWPEIEFSGEVEDGTLTKVVMPEKSAMRQLDRLGIKPGANMGDFRISRGANADQPDKPYWNVDTLDTPATHAAKATLAPSQNATAAPKPIAPARTHASGLAPDLRAAGRHRTRFDYLGTMRWVAGEMAEIVATVNKTKGVAITVDMGAVQAATFSLYKHMDTKGYLPEVEVVESAADGEGPE